MIHKVHLKYFGQIAEFTGKTSELLSFESGCITQLITHLEKNYPGLTDQDFKVAVDQEITDKNKTITKDVEIALLPPFAGG